MGALEQLMQLKAQGIPENQIIEGLRQEGFSPKQINDALSQSQIKNAVSGEEEALQTQGMEQSIMNEQPEAPVYPQEQYIPQTQEYTQQGYYEDQGQSGITSTDTIIEIAEQVFNEQIQKIQKQVKEISEFKAIAETKLESINDRLKRLENNFDKLQLEILGKVGSYGDSLHSIKKEMSMMQDSFGRVIKKSSSDSDFSLESEETPLRKKRK